MKQDDTELSAIFARIPQLNQFRPDDFEIQPLTGFTNRNYRIKNKKNDWVLRIPRQQTNRFIDRKHEAHNLALAAELGLARNSIWYDETGLSLTATLSDTRAAGRTDIENISRLNRLLADVYQLHHCGQIFQGELDIAQSLSQYFALVPATNRLRLEPYFLKTLAALESLPDQFTKKVPSHSDLILQNLLIEASGKFWIIDWEYSAMASPYWDLATLCNTARLGSAQCQNLLKAYNAIGAALEPDGLRTYQIALQLLTICWMQAFSYEDIDAELMYLIHLQA